MKIRIGSLYFLVIIFLCFFETTIAMADAYQDYIDRIAAKNTEIAACKATITHKQELIVDEQAGIDADTKSLEQAKKIYDIGLTKYKNMEAEVKGIEDKINNLSSNIFIMRSSYKDFYNAYLAYKDAWSAKNYERMNIEYLKMWRYSHGLEENPPYQDPVTGFYEVRKWFIKMGARWSIRSLNTVVSTINLVRSIVSIKDKISDVISVANEGFKAVFDYASNEAIDTIKESAIENLKAAGSETYKVIDDTLATAEALSDPLGGAQQELERMVKGIEKKESFGYPSKEEAIEKMTDLIVSSGDLHEQAQLDAKEILAEIEPVKDGIKGYENGIADQKEAQRIYYEHIKAQREKIIQLEQERSAIHYTYSVGNKGCTNYVSFISVSSKSGSILSLNRETASLTGYPTEIDIRATTSIAACQSASKTCTNEDGNTIIVSYTYQSGFSTELDSKLLSGRGTKLAFSSGKLSPTGAGIGEEAFTFTFPGKIQFIKYVESDLPCGVTTDVPTGSGEVKATRDFTIIEASDFFLIPQRYRKNQKPVGESFPKTYFTFFNKTETPYEEEIFWIAYKLPGEDYYQYKQVDELKVSVADLKTHPDGMVTGKFNLDGYMKVDGDTDTIKLASLTMYAENITPMVSFVDYQDQSVTITKGTVPLDKAIDASLVLTSGLNPKYGIDDYIKVKMIVDRFAGGRIYADTTFVKENIFCENFDYMGSPIPIWYEITIEEDGYGERTIATGDFGEDLIGSVQYDDFYMTEPGNQTEYLSHKNIFSWEKSSIDPKMNFDIHGTTLAGEDSVTNIGYDVIKDILFDVECVVGIQRSSECAYQQRWLYGFDSNTPLNLIGGQLTTERNYLYFASEGVVDPPSVNDEDEDDIGDLEDIGLFLSSNRQHFVAGFNYNAVKLRMRDVDGHRYFVFKVLGPTAMDTHSVLWTFTDDTTQQGTFIRNGITWESSIEADKNLKEVELFSSSMISQGKYQMADFVTESPTLYGIDENEFVIRMQEQFAEESGSYQLQSQKLQFVQNDRYRASVDFNFPVNNPAMNLERAAGVDMLAIEEISSSDRTLQFYLGMLPKFALQVLREPTSGSLVLDLNRIAYTASAGFSGTASFRIDLYGTISNPYGPLNEFDSSLKAVESRYIDVAIDYSGASPVLSVTAVYKSPINLTGWIGGSPQHYLEFDTAVQSAVAGGKTWITTTNDHIITYGGVAPAPYTNDFSKEDTLTLNDDYVIEVTGYNKYYGSREIESLPGETYVLSKQYIMALFYHIFSEPIIEFQPSAYKYTEGFVYRVLKDGTEVEYNSGGYPLDTFDTVELTYNPPLGETQPAGLMLTGRTADDYYTQSIFVFPQPGTFIPADIGVTPKTADFGSFVIGTTSSEKTFTVSNTGLVGLHIDSITMSGANASSFYVSSNACSNNKISPGENCIVKVVYSPVAQGDLTATMNISSDDPDTPNLLVPLSGTTETADFGSFAIGTTSPEKTFTVTNTGLVDLHIFFPITMSGANASSFYVSSNACSFNTISPGENCIVKVVFSPAAQGDLTATMNISSDDPDTPNLLVPLIGTTDAYTVDSDNDGISDNKDNCPETPAGSVVDADGCIIKGDLNKDSNIELEDSFLGLKVLTYYQNSADVSEDVDGDGIIGLKDVIYIIQRVEEKSGE